MKYYITFSKLPTKQTNTANTFVNIVNLYSCNFKNIALKVILLLFLCSSLSLKAQVPAYSSAFNYLNKLHIDESDLGAGFSFYAAVYPMLDQYPGPRNFQSGLVSTWMSTQRKETDPKYYTNIEGGLGWWRDTRFATETPKFIMGAVSHDFFAFANGPGAGKTSKLSDGHRDWSKPGGKYGAAQLSNKLLWPPDGINMRKGSNNEFLGYGYMPLPLTEPMTQTAGKNVKTGNQSWTLFFNASNFKGPVAFVLPTFWTEPTLQNPDLEGFFLDVRKSRSGGFAIEHQTSPALIGTDDNGEIYARDAKKRFPLSGSNKSILAKDILVYSKDALWNAMVSWFNNNQSEIPRINSEASKPILFNSSQSAVKANLRDYQYGSQGDNQKVNCEQYVKKFVENTKKTIGLEWDLNYVERDDNNFIAPEFFKLEVNNEPNNRWIPIAKSEVPSSTGLLENAPIIEPRKDQIPYLTPLEEDCHWQDPNGPWRSPGPSAGPFYVNLGDGSTVTYYWYRFIDQPSVIHANLPQNQRQILQERIEKIHRNWKHNDTYLKSSTSQTALVSVDSGLLVTPPIGMEIGYVPIVTRQEKTKDILSVSVIKSSENFAIYPNPTEGPLTIETKNSNLENIELFDILGKLIHNWEDINKTKVSISINASQGVYILKVKDVSGQIGTFKIVKSY